MNFHNTNAVSAQKKTVLSHRKAVFKCSVLEQKIRMAVFYAYESPAVRTPADKTAIRLQKP